MFVPVAQLSVAFFPMLCWFIMLLLVHHGLPVPADKATLLIPQCKPLHFIATPSVQSVSCRLFSLLSLSLFHFLDFCNVETY